MASPPNGQPFSKDPIHPEPPKAPDRRMRGRRAQPADRRMRRPRDQRERRRRRWLIALGVGIFLMIGGIVGYGYYHEFIAPPRVLAAQVGDTRYSQGDLVKRMRMLQADAAVGGPSLDFAQAPFEVLNSMAEAGVIRRFAPELNVQVTEAHIEVGLLQKFYPRVPEGQEAVPGQIEQEYKDAYQSFLNRNHLSDPDYRELIGERIYRAGVRAKLGDQVPSLGEQVEVHWISVSSDLLSSDEEPAGPDAKQVRTRLDTEDFEDVAAEVSVDFRYSDQNGFVGWVPKGAFPSLDETLFGSDEQEPIAHNEISQPIYSLQGDYIVKVTGGPETREISDLMREKLKDEVMAEWLLEQKTIGGKEGWFQVKFNSSLYAWAIDQVKQAAPRSTPPAGG